MKSFGQRLQDIRKEKNLSQQQLAEVVGVLPPVVGRYERDEVTPSVAVAARLAQAVQVPLDYLVGHDQGPRAAAFDQALTARMAALVLLPAPEQERIPSVLDSLIRDARVRALYS